ncbi:L,D-transpeptidase [Pseudonocardia sp. GCM10023141]|uniref:L,D-transpeptidase n=1 Tax=Pseudonocardia sp. GCM10023141 TaxID=3252653 RepID=UPI003622BBC3
MMGTHTKTTARRKLLVGAVSIAVLGAVSVAGVAAAAPGIPAPSGGRPEASPCETAAKACVRLSTHQAWLTDGAGVTTLGPVLMNDGASQTPTPTGMFTVQWKDRNHRSSEFNNAPMPYAVFFDTNGRAFHAGDPARQSAGCARLDPANAQKFFDALQPNDRVQILQ